MDTFTKRMTMNTSLKNARIFDDDSWDEEKFQVKNESLNKIKIKQEPLDDEGITKQPKSEVKTEVDKPPTPLTSAISGHIKAEREIKKEKVDDFSESPFTKALFANFNLKQETPVKTEIEQSATTQSGSSRKSVKRTIFTRDSPYKLQSNENGRTSGLDDKTQRTRASVKSRLGPKINSDDEESSPRKKTRRTCEVESDPATLQRRQKQIDFGKNTIGYDNYIKTVPRSKRASDDPQTPNKFSKYSRRGWDGLIKQWRLRLHKYDPDEEAV